MKLLVHRLVIIAAMCLAAPAVFAHHGYATYDMSKELTLKGTVTEFEWINPHAVIDFAVKDEKGAVTKWTAETDSPNILHRGGWVKTTLKPGDGVTISGNRAKDGSNDLRLKKIVKDDGTVLNPQAAY